MLRFLTYIEKLLYVVRDSFWQYPDLIFGRGYIPNRVRKLYLAFSPISHFFGSFVIIFLIILIGPIGLLKNVLSNGNQVLVEAVVVGVSSNGQTQQIRKVNPLVPSNIQFEKDLVELIYEPLFKYEYLKSAAGNNSSGVTLILADRINQIINGADYQIRLKQGVKWHDSTEFTAYDVVETFNKLSQLNTSSSYVLSLKQMQWSAEDMYTVSICTKLPNTEQVVGSCGDPNIDRPILSNFLELISVPIVQAEKIRNVQPIDIENSEAALFRKPVGTGKFLLNSVTDSEITLDRFANYHEESLKPTISQVVFKLFPTVDLAIKAVQNGEVHSVVTNSIEYNTEMKSYKAIEQYRSPVLYNQFWGLFFNLKKNLDGSAFGPSFLNDVNVRRAISLGISRNNIIDSLEQTGEESFGPIPVVSEFYNANANWYTYNLNNANTLLNETEWNTYNSDGFRVNDAGEELRFSLYFVENYDRRRIAESVQADLKKIGVNVVIDRKSQPGQDSSEDAPEGWQLNELNEQILAPRSFDVILYGMETFIDPDRFELFHSSQNNHPNLNISNFIGTDETLVAIPIDQRDESGEDKRRVSKIDTILENTRKIDPSNFEKRKTEYFEFQSLLAEDVPLVFLYHPQFVYYVHNSVENVVVENVSSIEDRYRNIHLWSVE